MSPNTYRRGPLSLLSLQGWRDLVSDSMAIDIGSASGNMPGREPRDVSLVYPLVDGVVADFERTQKMLDQFVRRARSGFSHFSRRAIMSVLSGVTQVEQRALLAASTWSRRGSRRPSARASRWTTSARRPWWTWAAARPTSPSSRAA